MNPWWWLLVPAAYVLGSLSFAYWAGRLRGLDLRQHGSGNLGATNAGRVLGPAYFWVVFLLDLNKGLVPVLCARHGVDAADPWLAVCVALAAVLGHVFTCFHRFRGGKAVATALGALIGLLWQVAAVSATVWLFVWLVQIVGYGKGRSASVGLASAIAALAAIPAQLLSAPTWTAPTPWSMPSLPLTLFVCLAAVLILIRHRANLTALMRTRREAAATASPVSPGAPPNP